MNSLANAIAKLIFRLLAVIWCLLGRKVTKLDFLDVDR